MDPPDDDAVLIAATIPVVLWVMPLLGSPAPADYIYDPTPSPDGRLLGAASAFFTHHNHQVFLDPCLDLIAYLRAGGIMATIIDVNQLSDHVLSKGLNLLEPPSSSSKVDALGTSYGGVPSCTRAGCSPRFGLLFPYWGRSRGTVPLFFGQHP
jgi:hypothetical protein